MRLGSIRAVIDFSGRVSSRSIIAVSVGPRAYIVFPVALRGIRRMLTGPGGRFAHGIFRLTVFPARPEGCGAIFAMRYETELKTQAMKSIVRMTVAAAVLLFSAGSLVAQGPDGQKMTPEQRAERMTRRMTEQLSLSDEQAGRSSGFCSIVSRKCLRRRGVPPASRRLGLRTGVSVPAPSSGRKWTSRSSPC